MPEFEWEVMSQSDEDKVEDKGEGQEDMLEGF